MSTTGIISPCSNSARSLLGRIASQPNASVLAKTGIAADISIVARRGMPRKSIQAAIGAVMLKVRRELRAQAAA